MTRARTTRRRAEPRAALQAVQVEMVKTDGRVQFVPVPGGEFEIPADLVLLAMGFTGPRKAGPLDGFGVAFASASSSNRAVGSGIRRAFSINTPRPRGGHLTAHGESAIIGAGRRPSAPGSQRTDAHVSTDRAGDGGSRARVGLRRAYGERP
jgi:hypothetical protein